MAKIAFIGGGSAKFVRQSVVDLLSFDDLRDSRVVLMDINAERMALTERLVAKMSRDTGAGMQVESTTDQRAALDGADYVVLTLMVGGMKHYASDTEIPARHGVLPAVGDTIGPAAVFRLIRTAPVLEQLVRNLREVAPQAWVLNYANPMAMLTQALIELGHERTVGLCHAVQGSFHPIADFFGIPREEIRYTAAGLNHLNFYLTLEHNGRDLYPEIRANLDRIIAETAHWEADTWQRERRGVERVRMELVKHLGYLSMESHAQGDYYPWFRKDAGRIRHYGPPAGWGYHFDRLLAAQVAPEIERQLSGAEPIPYGRSSEYGVPIIHSLATDTPRRVFVNVYNRGAIANLPPRCVVEVPCLADGLGVHACRVGEIPAQLAGVMHPHVTAHRLAVDGALRRDRGLIRQSIQADPLTAAVLTLPQIETMCEELFVENRDYMTGW